MPSPLELWCPSAFMLSRSSRSQSFPLVATLPSTAARSMEWVSLSSPASLSAASAPLVQTTPSSLASTGASLPGPP